MGALLASVFLSKPSRRAESTNIVHIDSEVDFKTHVLDVKSICLVDLFSNQCPPCRVLAPTISSLADICLSSYLLKLTDFRPQGVFPGGE